MRLTIEVARSMEDILSDGIKELKKRIKKQYGVEIKSLSFVETDSSNWSHACAYFNATIKGQPERVIRAARENCWDKESIQGEIRKQKIHHTSKVMRELNKEWDT